MKYLHIMSADVKFVESTIRLFEYANQGNNFYLINGSPQSEWEEIIDANNILFCNGFINKNTYRTLPDFKEYDVVVIHDLSLGNAIMANHVKSGKALLWLPWGGDVTNKLGYVSSNPYQHYTEKLVKSFWWHKVKNNAIDIITLLYHCITFRPSPRKLYRAIFSQINFVATPIFEDFKTLSKAPTFKAEYVGAFYYYLSDLQAARERNSAVSLDIYLGNSAGPSSNHLDMLLKLSKMEVTDRKIIVPLSYNISIEGYRKEIVKVGRRFWGDNFVPLLNFMPRKEYASVISQCGIAILNHEQQQAVGNAIILLFSGAKLFLSIDSPVFKFLIEKGFHVFSVQKDLTATNISCLLTEAEQNYNRELAIKEFGEERVKEVATSLINLVNSYTPRIINK